MKKFREQFCATILLMGFLLGVKDDRLALWSGDDPQPLQIFPVRVSTLPLADQLLLKAGLQASDRWELMILLEDYL